MKRAKKILTSHGLIKEHNLLKIVSESNTSQWTMASHYYVTSNKTLITCWGFTSCQSENQVLPRSGAHKTKLKIENTTCQSVYLQRSLSRGRRTSPMICPTLWRDFKSSSVLANSFFEFLKLSLTTNQNNWDIIINHSNQENNRQNQSQITRKLLFPHLV